MNELQVKENEVAVKENEVAVKQNFVTENEGVDLGFVFENDYIFGKVNKKGQFIVGEKVYGDIIDVQVITGKNRYVLWGKDDSAQSGTILLSEDTAIDAAKTFKDLCDRITDFEEQYSPADIQERYLLTVSMPDEVEATFDLSFTNKLRFGQFGKKLYKGDFEGYPEKTTVRSCTLRMHTEEFKIKNGSGSYTGIQFSVAVPSVEKK